MQIIKRFLKSKGGLRFRILYALDYERDLYKRRYFLASTVKPGEFIKVDKYGTAYPAHTQQEKEEYKKEFKMV